MKFARRSSRAYLGCKHRSLDKEINPPSPFASVHFAPSIFVDTLSSSGDQSEAKLTGHITSNTLERFFLHLLHSTGGGYKIRVMRKHRGDTHVRNTLLLHPLFRHVYPSPSYRGISLYPLGNSERYRRPASGYSNLPSSCRLEETTSFTTAHFPPSPRRAPSPFQPFRSSFVIRKIGGRSVYERIPRPDISIPLPRDLHPHSSIHPLRSLVVPLPRRRGSEECRGARRRSDTTFSSLYTRRDNRARDFARIPPRISYLRHMVVQSARRTSNC